MLDSSRAHTSYGFAIDRVVENAVLRGNWEEVIERLTKDEARKNSPVERLLMGHATLATNRNNAALLLFRSVEAERELKEWSTWIDSLLRRHPQEPILLYLSADTQARTGSLTRSMEIFVLTRRPVRL